MSALARSQSDVDTPTIQAQAQTQTQTQIPPPSQDDHELLDFDVGGLHGGEEELRDVENGEAFRNGEESGDGTEGNGIPGDEFPAPSTTMDTKTSSAPQQQQTRITEVNRLGNHQHAALTSSFESASPSSTGAVPPLASEPRYDALPSAAGQGVTTLSLASAAPPPHGTGEYQPHDGMEGNGIGMDDSTAAAMRYKDMSLLPTRRQNVACDACRARKVKCVRMPMADKVRRFDRTLEK